MTLARVKRDRRAGPLEAEAPPRGPLDAADLTLYRSTLRPQGAVYDPLERLRLGEGVRLRQAHAGDADPIARVNVRAWQAAYRGLLPDDTLDSLSTEDSAAAWLKGLADESFESWVAERGEIVGYVAFGPARRERLPAGSAEVYALYVDPEEQRRGIGRLLLDRAAERLGRQDYRHAVLYVIEGNDPGLAFYEAAGWTLEKGPEEGVVRGLTMPLLRYGLELS